MLKKIVKKPLKLKRFMAVVLSLGIIVGSLSILSFIKRSQTSQATGLQIQSVFPRIGTPAGGDKVRIRGKDFQQKDSLVQVSASGSCSCVLGSNSKAYCWGENDYGQLGDNSTTDARTPVAVHQGQIPVGVKLTQISVSGMHTCALGSNGRAYCWGNNQYGKLGNNSETGSLTPVAVHQGQIPTGVTLTQIVASWTHTCVLGSDSKAYCWGYNENGQLGNNSGTNSRTPVAVQQGQKIGRAHV